MRIAWTGPVGETGGVPGMGLLMLQELLRQGVEVDLYLATDRTVSSLPVAPAPGLRVIVHRSRWQWNRWYSRGRALALFTSLASRSLSNLLLSLRLIAEHRRRRYDAVFQLSTTELFLLGRVGRLAPPLVVHPCSHAAGELRWHRAERKYALGSEGTRAHLLVRAWLELRSRIQAKELVRADVIVGPSRRFVQLLHQDYGVPEAKLRVLRHPVDLDRFTPGPPQDRAVPRTLLFISRISARKGVAEIVELSHRLADLRGRIRLLIIGGPTMWSDYRGHLADLNAETAEYLGPLSAGEIPHFMRAGTMLLVPSRYEPGSIVTGEALACGLPVVLSDEVGSSEILRGPHARVHRAGDVDDLEAAVRSLLDASDTDNGALHGSARDDAETHFAPQVIISQLIDILASVSDGAASAAAPAQVEPSDTGWDPKALACRP